MPELESASYYERLPRLQPTRRRTLSLERILNRKEKDSLPLVKAARPHERRRRSPSPVINRDWDTNPRRESSRVIRRPKSVSPPRLTYYVDRLARKVPDPTPPAAERTTVFLDPSAPEDVTIHMDLDVAPDIESDLEWFSRLRRLGHFHAAREYFEDRLHRYLENSYVLVQYGQFLLDAADYNELVNLSLRFSVNHFPKILACHWYILLLKVKARSEAFVVLPSLAHREVSEVVSELANRVGVGSLETQLLINAMPVLSPSGRLRTLTPLYFRNLYEVLWKDGRIWEFRDLLYEMLDIYGFQKTMRILSYGREPLVGSDIIEQLDEAWQSAAEEETSALALLDIYSRLAFASLGAAPDPKSTSAFIRAGHAHAVMLSCRDPSYLKSRPYFMWTMAKVQLAYYRCGDWLEFKEHIEDSPGILFVPRAIFPLEPLPVYLPHDSETPGLPEGSPALKEMGLTVTMILRAAEEVGDVDMAASCLQRLIMQATSQEVEGLLSRLIDLWRSAGNHRRVRLTYLFSYLLATSPSSRDRLLEDILTSGESPDDDELNFARFVILRALTRSDENKDLYNSIAKRLFARLNKDQYGEALGFVKHTPSDTEPDAAQLKRPTVVQVDYDPQINPEERYVRRIKEKYGLSKQPDKDFKKNSDGVGARIRQPKPVFPARKEVLEQPQTSTGYDTVDMSSLHPDSVGPRQKEISTEASHSVLSRPLAARVESDTGSGQGGKKGANGPDHTE